jgi:hypothetical protein
VTRLGTAPKKPTRDLIDKVEAQLGRRTTRWHKPRTGLTPAQRFVVGFEDGSSAFVKAAVDSETERWLRTDHLMMSTVDSDLVPEVIAWIEAGSESVLIIEDLHDAHWPADYVRRVGSQTLPVLWKPGQLDLLFGALEHLASTPAPATLPSLCEGVAPAWTEIVLDPMPFLELGLCSERWLERSLQRLLAAEAALDLSGDALVHNDVRSDNVCFRGDRVILVDWSDARRGCPEFDRNCLSACVLEGGPEPYDLMPNAGSFAAWRGAWLARRAISETTSPTWLIAVMKRMAIIHLQWAALCLDLPSWDGPAWQDL